MIIRPNDSDTNFNSITFTENQNQNKIQYGPRPGCRRCANLKSRKIQLIADNEEFQKKCQLLRAENAKLRIQFRTWISKALRLGQIISNRNCKICLASVSPNQLNQHMCRDQAEIKCEYCTDVSFTSTMNLYGHLSSGIHKNMKFYKCSKCSIGFPLRILTEFHENSNQTHLDASQTNQSEHKYKIEIFCRWLKMARNLILFLKLCSQFQHINVVSAISHR